MAFLYESVDRRRTLVLPYYRKLETYKYFLRNVACASLDPECGRKSPEFYTLKNNAMKTRNGQEESHNICHRVYSRQGKVPPWCGNYRLNNILSKKMKN